MSVRVCMRRLLRMALWLRAERLWRLKPGPAFTLPVAVILKRFLTDDLVFILGIWFSFLAALARSPGQAQGVRKRSRPGMPISRPGRAIRGGCIAAGGGGCKRGATDQDDAASGCRLASLYVIVRIASVAKPRLPPSAGQHRSLYHADLPHLRR